MQKKQERKYTKHFLVRIEKNNNWEYCCALAYWLANGRKKNWITTMYNK